VVELRLRSVSQILNVLDPSPFHERDLDDEAEEYIVTSARELPGPVGKLVVYLPRAEAESAEARALPETIHHYFAYRLWARRAALSQRMREGRLALLIGLAFLLVCVLLRQLVAGAGGMAGEVLSEGLLIAGWVAMWRPIKIVLYDWWPARSMCRLYERLSQLPVEVRPL
jgi:hypothetical protein